MASTLTSPILPTPDLTPNGSVNPKRALLDLATGYSNNIRFYLNGVAILIKDASPTITLLTYLRQIGLTGSKLGCGEGGCGACTVVVGYFNSTTNKLYHASVNACLAPLVSIDGKHVITVEGIGTSANPHSVQERIGLGNGSQCGFCTPGIVMSMYALLRNTNGAPSAEEVEEAFDGNLCRCTGYRPILDAAQTFARPAGCCREGGNGSGRAGGCCMDKKDEKEDSNLPPTTFVPPTFKKYTPDTELIFPSKLKTHTFLPLSFGNSEKLWLRPVTLFQLLQIKSAYPACKLVAGSSETQIEVKFKGAKYDVSVYVCDILELRSFSFEDGFIHLGANITLTDLEYVCELVLERYGPSQGQTFAAIAKQLRYFAGRQIRNVGTLAGNLATASPISDLNPVLLAVGAFVEVKSLTKTSKIHMAEFFTGYRQTAIPPDSVITRIMIPLCYPSREFVRAYKQAKRKDDDIAIVTACFRVVLSANNEDGSANADSVVLSATLAYGGMAALTKAVQSAADFLVGRVWKRSDTLEGVFECLEREFNLQYDVPGGMPTYRKTLALGFFYRFYQDVLAELGAGTGMIAEGAVGTQTATGIANSGTSGKRKHSPDPGDEPALPSLNLPPPPAITDSVVDPGSVPEISREISFGAKDLSATVAYAGTTLGSALPHVAALKQCTGEAQYTDDLPHLTNELFGCLVLSTNPHANIISVDTSAAFDVPGVHRWVDHTDLPDPASNYWGIFKDEPFFAVDRVHTVGQPIGIILADSADIAEEAARAVKVEYQSLPAIFTIEEAIEKGSLFDYSHEIKNGDVNAVFDSADNVFSGVARMGGQEHFYLETNACIVIPKPEDGELEIISSTQNPTEVQAYAAQITGVPLNRVVSKIKRLGGGFGGKETRSVQLACICALAARVSKRPVRAMLTRDQDIATSGQRHPFLGKWKVAVDSDGRFLALDVDIYANAGWTWDLSAAVVDRALSHVDNVYHIPVIHARGHVAKTNTVSNTAFRGFGGPQGMFITESFVSEIADLMGFTPERLREINMYHGGELTHFNQSVPVNDWHVRMMYDQVVAESDYWNRKKGVAKFNRENKWRKRGMALIPTKFGISFTAPHLNQAGALVHIYHDGSVLVAHGGTEMGQGLHTKMIMIAAEKLGIPASSVFISETATNTVANTSPTAASASSDLNGYAVFNACEELNNRLAPYREKLGQDAAMKDLAHAAYFDRVNLSANGYYRTPEIGYVWGENRGKMSYYFTQGVAAAEVEIDTLTGDWTCLRADIKMDVGRSINPAIDYGQIEGAFIQGQGLFTTEESLWHRGSGHIFTRGPGTYKIPGFRDVPQQFNVSLLKGVEWENLRTIQRSRGVGEPPLFLGSVVFFAIRDALTGARAEWNPNLGFRTDEDGQRRAVGVPAEEVVRLRSPATVERIRMSCVDPILARCTVSKGGKEGFFVEI